MKKISNGIIIAVDAGHGSNTAGKRTPNMPVDIDFDGDGIVDVKKGTAIKEHIANVGVCVFLDKELERCGFKVFKSGWQDEDATDDEDVDLATRQELIRKAGCQYSVSVHFNAFGDGKEFNIAEGVGTYYHSNDDRIGDSKLLATIIHKHLTQGTVQKDRGLNRGSFAMVNCINLNTKASVLVELAFMTNKREAISMMGNAAFWKESAVEICKGFCEYLNVRYIGENEEKKEEEKKEEQKGDEKNKGEKFYIVQVGAFQKLSNAKVLKEKMIKAGYSDAFIKKSTENNIILYRVQVGAFHVKSNAVRMLSKLHQTGFDAIIKENER